MSDILCVTHRILCREEFLLRTERIARARPRGILLREKDLCEEEYKALAETVMEICGRNGTPCILHTYARAARELGCFALHLPLPVLRTLSDAEKACFSTLGASCHSAEDAVEAQQRGCSYITAGHIFATDCKKGLPGRGLDFLKEVCAAVRIPVYAIGGIAPGNIGDVRRAGAAGACVMSGAMTCGDVRQYLASFEGENHEIS